MPRSRRVCVEPTDAWGSGAGNSFERQCGGAQNEVGLPAGTPQVTSVEEASVSRWLMRLHDAARLRTYAGTFVVTVGDTLSTSRIWHVCDGQQQIERVDALTGAARSTFRRNDQVMTFLPDRRVVISETRDSLGLFPNLLNRADSSVARYYRLKTLGQERVAGLDSDVVQLVPVDALRFGYKSGPSRKRCGDQAADARPSTVGAGAGSVFRIQLNAPVNMAKLVSQMNNTQGYQVKYQSWSRPRPRRKAGTSSSGVPASNHRLSQTCENGSLRPKRSTLQCVFSDGLATVSLFIETFDPARHGKLPQHQQASIGATQMLMRPLGAWWLTAVGEVPLQTLAAFTTRVLREESKSLSRCLFVFLERPEMIRFNWKSVYSSCAVARRVLAVTVSTALFPTTPALSAGPCLA